jgi:hypothetical protein
VVNLSHAINMSAQSCAAVKKTRKELTSAYRCAIMSQIAIRITFAADFATMATITHALKSLR